MTLNMHKVISPVKKRYKLVSLQDFNESPKILTSSFIKGLLCGLIYSFLLVLDRITNFQLARMNFLYTFQSLALYKHSDGMIYRCL